MSTKSYPWIVKWGRLMGSYQYYIDGQIEAARQSDAPDNAIYHDGERWQTTDDVTSPATRQRLGLEPL
jgi:hypothetical protein